MFYFISMLVYDDLMPDKLRSLTRMDLAAIVNVRLKRITNGNIFLIGKTIRTIGNIKGQPYCRCGNVMP
jgi:hypothetical protein